MADTPESSESLPTQHTEKVRGAHGKEPDWVLVRQLAVTGTTLGSICKIVMKTPMEIDAWAHQRFGISIQHLMERWRDTGHSMLREAQFKSAVVDGNPLMLKFLGVNVLGQDKEQTVEVQLPKVLLPPRRIDGIDDALPPPDFAVYDVTDEMEAIAPPDLTQLTQFETANGDIRHTYQEMAKIAQSKTKRKRKSKPSKDPDEDGSDD